MNHKLTKEEIEEQFEQFLKESVSDESVDLGNSPKSSVLNSLGKHNRKETKKDTKPWWINEDDSDNGQPPLRRFTKLKRQPAVIDAGTETLKIEIGEEHNGNPQSQSPGSHEDMLPTNQSYLKSQRFPQSIAETEEEQQAEKILLQGDERSSVSISRDSLEPNDSIVASGPAQTTFGPGLDTLEEEEEKEQFFANLETGASSTIDYSRLIKELESTGSTPINALNQQEDEFAALEEEETNEVESPRPKSVTASRHYSEDFEEDSVQIGEEFESNNNITKAKYILDGIEDAREAKEQEVKPGMLAKVILLDSLDSTLDTQKLLQSGDDRSMEKQSTDGKIGLDTASQMNTTAISGGQTNSDIEALHQAYRKIDQSLESTGAGQDSINGRDTNFAVHPQSHVGDSAKNISTTESDLPTVEELMKPIKGDAVFPRGFDLHSISTNAQQEGEVAATCSKPMDSSGPSLFQPQLNSNISCERPTYQEVSESSLKQNANHTSRISDDDVEALINEIKNDSASKHSLVASTSQAVSHRDYQIYAKAKSPSLTNKKHFGGNYTSVRSSGYGKVSSLKKDPLGASEKPTHLSPTKQAVPVKGFKTRSSPDHTKGRPKGQLFITQTIRSEKQKPAENNLENPLFTSMQSSFTPLQRQMNSGPNHTKLLGGLAPEQLITRDNWELSKGNGQRLSEPGSVCRELVLLQKLEEAHEKWSTEHGLVEKLKEKLERKEEELVGKNEELKKLPQLNEEIYMLQSKVNICFGSSQKLYKQKKSSYEDFIFCFFIREQLKKKNMKQVSIHDVQPSEQNKNQNIDDLVSQLRIQQREEVKLTEEIKKLKQEKQALEVDLEKMKKECNMAKEQLTNTSGDKDFVMKIMEEQNKQEIHRLTKRLQWYAENQEMLDRDTARLKTANGEIEKLKEQIEKLAADSKSQKSPPEKRAKGRALEAKRIQDLERQVKEMEEIIRRRYPNSLPALIYAAASVPDASAETEGNLYSRAFLEKRIKKLEADLEGKDEEAKKCLRTMEQQFQKIKIQYEQRVSELEQFLTHKIVNEKEKLDADSKMKILEEEILKLKEAHKFKENHLRGDIEKLKNQLYQAELKLMEREDSSLRMVDQHMHNSYQQAKIEKLNLELAAKNREIQELSKTLERLQAERRLLLNNKTATDKYDPRQKSTKKSRKGKESTLSFPAAFDEKAYQPNDFSDSHISEVLKENDILKNNIERLSLEMDKQRVQLAQYENEVRRTQGGLSEHVAALNASHQQEIEQILTQHALEHSSSKVAELANKITAQEVMIKHLREQITELQKDREALSFAKLREEKLQTQIAKLFDELGEAKENHSPEMRHFVALERKIQKMELKYAQREQEFQQLIQKARHSADADQIQEVEKWKKLAQLKNYELEHFRTELDSILDVLRELQRQGIVIPAPSSVRQNIATFTRQL
ncbi:LOW QUALITY PROTEIN: centrosomal protein of 162 kDa [Leucoraja erinacea]|uniref:LOW QUALITY PROTEIN: centrosomal protein of 162 kDa n=1 Tax=Leucoraja erinaceus TaxID=7782 RepID=UPI0024589074|nr:LOW QUALITY PROTEIN: centrosomal protein of 162 kDa [Leucoraja erinacea]